MSRIIVTIVDSARRDLDDVAHWYAARHPAGRARFFDEFGALIDMLSTFPSIGRKRDEILKDARSHVIHPFIVFSRYDEAAGIVRVLRIVHGRRDMALLDGPETVG